MPRPIDPLAQYRIKPHKTNGYVYASTQPSYIDSQTSTKRYKHIHWGKLDDNHRFIPGAAYYLATPEERKMLIFPENWDLSEVKRTIDLPSSGKPIFDDEYRNRLYGDIWLLEQIANETGIRQDLEIVFSENTDIVNDILTLAMFPYLTKFTYNRVHRWQRIAASLSTKELTASEITRLTQSITEHHRMNLLKLRAQRLTKDELCAVDSTSRTAYGNSLADIRWGKNKENLPLPQTMEAVVYNISRHMPIYYRSFPGNMPDSRSLDIILDDLDQAGFRDIALITDRGYESIEILKKYILRGQSVIMCAKTSQKDVAEKIRQLGIFDTRPKDMKVDPEAKIYYRQYVVDYNIKNIDKSQIKTTQININLYFDPLRRTAELLEMDICLALQEETLVNMMSAGEPLENDDALKRDFCYYDLTYDATTRVLSSYKINEKKVKKNRNLSGFFSIITHGVPYDAMETFKIYSLRDEQEKCFQQMKDQMVSDRQRNWSEDGKTGRLFILFISLILGSYLRYAWSSTKLRELFSSSLDILDEMRSIRLIERDDGTKRITPFVGRQVDICKILKFEIPGGCKPTYHSQINVKRKRGRPPKK